MKILQRSDTWDSYRRFLSVEQVASPRQQWQRYGDRGKHGTPADPVALQNLGWRGTRGDTARSSGSDNKICVWHATEYRLYLIGNGGHNETIFSF